MWPPDADQLDLDVGRNRDGVRVAVSGEINTATAQRFVRAIIDEMPRADSPLTLDLAQVRFVDSAGLAALVHLRNRQSNGCSLRLTNMPASVRRVLEITRLLDYFMVDDTAAGSANQSQG